VNLRSGELFAGVGGLSIAIDDVFEADQIWFAEIEPAPSKVLDARFPGVPNLGDVTRVEWATASAVDVMSGGFPCQDLSLAGRRAGMRKGTRSGLWADFLQAITEIRPRWVVIENVRGLLSGCAESDLEPCPGCVGDGEHRPVLRALGRVLGDLADLGFDAEWCGLRASDVGAPHGRFRVFVLAWPADRTAPDSDRV
jgi:DNA (cytosine-5)-methyltransferase 1